MNTAMLNRHTQPVTMSNAWHELNLLVKPGTDLDQRFQAWDVDGEDWIYVNGWLFNVEA